MSVFSGNVQRGLTGTCDRVYVEAGLFDQKLHTGQVTFLACMVKSRPLAIISMVKRIIRAVLCYEFLVRKLMRLFLYFLDRFTHVLRLACLSDFDKVSYAMWILRLLQLKIPHNALTFRIIHILFNLYNLRCV